MTENQTTQKDNTGWLLLAQNRENGKKQKRESNGRAAAKYQELHKAFLGWKNSCRTRVLRWQCLQRDKGTMYEQQLRSKRAGRGW